MVRWIHHATLLGLLLCLGCGKKSEVAGNSPNSASGLAAQSSPATSGSAQSTLNEPSPGEIVSQFLDQVRRGGDNSDAGNLLTELARAELKRIGRSLEPIGSPDARFRVTRAEIVPGEEQLALVHSIWSEPNAEGGQDDFQVVWAVTREPVGWRISGLAMEMSPEQAPVIIDFENGELMAKLLGTAEPPSDSPAKNGSDVPSQATTPVSTLSR